MRSQFFDGFDFAEYKFSIVAVEHVDEFFNIEKYGLHPVIYDESCLRGYACIFGFTEDKHLALHKLFTNNNGRPATPLPVICATTWSWPFPTLVLFSSPMDLSRNISFLSDSRFPMPLKRYMNSPLTRDYSCV